MPLSTSAFAKPYLATTGHSSGGASSTLGQPRWTAVSQIRSIFHFHSVALRHQYASDCLMRPFLTTRLLLRTGMHYSMPRRRRPPFLCHTVATLAIESMRKIFSYAAMAAMLVLAWSADGASAVQKKAPAKKTAAKKKASTAKKGTSKKGTSTASARKPGTTTKSASSRVKKTPAKR